MINTTHDVLISGLGPTGAVLAGLLGQRGVKVAVFDSLDDLYPLPRAVGLDHEAMRIVQELGISEQLSKIIDHYRPSEYRGMDGQLIKRLDTEPPPYRLGWEPNYVFNQPKFEYEIRARLDEISNVQVFKKSEVISSEQKDGVVSIEVKHGSDGTVKSYSGRFMVACDGGSSPTRKRLGVELEDLGFDEPWLVVDAIVPKDVSDRLPQTQVQYCEAERPCTFVYCTEDHRRWEIMLDMDEFRTGDFPDEMLWPILSRWIKPGEVKLWRRAAYRFHGLIAKNWRVGNIFLAGDSAHMTPPFMAQGMGQGLRDVHNLAWKIDWVLKGKASDGILDTYELERKPHVRTTTLKAMELGRLICERDPVKAHERDKRLLDEQGGSIKTTFRQQMIPSLTVGLLHKTSSSGSVFPQPFVEVKGKKVRLDDTVGSEFVLFVDLDNTHVNLEDVQKAVAKKPIRVIGVSSHSDTASKSIDAFESVMLKKWFKDNAACIALVRPDKYVYGSVDSLKALEEMLQIFENNFELTTSFA